LLFKSYFTRSFFGRVFSIWWSCSLACAADGAAETHLAVRENLLLRGVESGKMGRLASLIKLECGLPGN